MSCGRYTHGDHEGGREACYFLSLLFRWFVRVETIAGLCLLVVGKKDEKLDGLYLLVFFFFPTHTRHPSLPPLSHSFFLFLCVPFSKVKSVAKCDKTTTTKQSWSQRMKHNLHSQADRQTDRQKWLADEKIKRDNDDNQDDNDDDNG